LPRGVLANGIKKSGWKKPDKKDLLIKELLGFMGLGDDIEGDRIVLKLKYDSFYDPSTT
jgi:hypothetical protein